MAYKTKQHVFVPNLRLFGPTKLQVQEVGEFSVTYIWENGLFIDLKLEETFQNQLINTV